MSTVRIEFDRKDPVYEPGERIEGVVHVHASKAMQCNGLKLSVRWRSEGDDIAEESGLLDASQVEVEQVRHIPEGHVPYRFAVNAPAGPFSYRGKRFSFGWRLEVQVDIPWAIDLKTSLGFRLVPARSASARASDGGYRQMARVDQAAIDLGEAAVASDAKSPVAWHSLVGALGLVGGNVAIALATPCMFVALLCTVPAAIHFIYRAIQIHKGQRAVGDDIYATASPRELSPGDELTLNTLFTPPKDFRVEELSAQVIAQEIVVRGQGSSTRTYRADVFNEKLALAAPGTTFAAGESVDVRKVLALPLDVPLSIGIPRNEVRWEVRFKVDGVGVPHWSSVQVIVVKPKPV